MRVMKVLLMAVLVVGLLGAGKVKVGDEAFVACKLLPVHQEASAYSPKVAQLNFGQPAHITGVVNAVAGGKEEAAWYKVDVNGKQGFVPARCLVSSGMLQRQDPNMALSKAQTKPNEVAGKGFSQTEEGDLTAMKGATGSAKSGNANYAAIDTILDGPAQFEPCSAYEPFRKGGGLVEFKGMTPTGESSVSTSAAPRQAGMAPVKEESSAVEISPDAFDKKPAKKSAEPAAKEESSVVEISPDVFKDEPRRKGNVQ